MRIEVIYFEGCPNHAATPPRVRKILARAGVSTEIEVRRITDNEAARRGRFLGSRPCASTDAT